MAKFKLPLIIIVIIACANKAPPISKDRLNPRLQKVVAINNRQIQFTFSEEIDTLTLSPGNFTVRNNGDTLKIVTLYSSLSTSEIVAITEAQSDIVYNVSGYVYDLAENKGTFENSFSGSSVQDTISPWLIQCSKGKNNKKFRLKFSEAMDTTFLEFRIIPKKNFVPVWQNYRVCEFIPETPFDSLNYDTSYYLYIDNGVYDISGNPLCLFITEVTPDTIYAPITLRGTAMANDTSVQAGLAVMRREIVLGITMVEDGEFLFRVRDSLPYGIEVVSGEYSGGAEMSAGKKDTIILKMEERSIDSIIN